MWTIWGPIGTQNFKDDENIEDFFTEILGTSTLI